MDKWRNSRIQYNRITALSHTKRSTDRDIANFHGLYKNSPVPLKLVLPEDVVDELCIVKIADGLVAIENILQSENKLIHCS